VDAGQELDQRRLARAVLAHQRMDLAGPQVQADALEDFHRAEALLDAMGDQHVVTPSPRGQPASRTQYFLFGNSAAATSLGKMPPWCPTRGETALPATGSFAVALSCGPSSGLHSTVTFSLPAIIASKAPLTPSIEMIVMSCPGLRPASSIAWIAPIAMSS